MITTGTLQGSENGTSIHLWHRRRLCTRYVPSVHAVAVQENSSEGKCRLLDSAWILVASCRPLHPLRLLLQHASMLTAGLTSHGRTSVESDVKNIRFQLQAFWPAADTRTPWPCPVSAKEITLGTRTSMFHQPQCPWSYVAWRQSTHLSGTQSTRAEKQGQDGLMDHALSFKPSVLWHLYNQRGPVQIQLSASRFSAFGSEPLNTVPVTKKFVSRCHCPEST